MHCIDRHTGLGWHVPRKLIHRGSLFCLFVVINKILTFLRKSHIWRKQREQERERDALGYGLLVNLEDVNGHATSCGELLVADMAFEVLGLLVLDQYLLVIEFSVAVVAPHLLRSLLLLPHRFPFSLPLLSFLCFGFSSKEKTRVGLGLGSSAAAAAAASSSSSPFSIERETER